VNDERDSGLRVLKKKQNIIVKMTSDLLRNRVCVSQTKLANCYEFSK